MIARSQRNELIVLLCNNIGGKLIRDFVYYGSNVVGR